MYKTYKIKHAHVALLITLIATKTTDCAIVGVIQWNK